uniref:Endonuclease/exonuclease/phosphatase family protein n=1 Tax=Rhizophora mucronata TaxID=61149 RepID=A0A2P2NJ79_RHIMU
MQGRLLEYTLRIIVCRLWLSIHLHRTLEYHEIFMLRSQQDRFINLWNCRSKREHGNIERGNPDWPFRTGNTHFSTWMK